MFPNDIAHYEEKQCSLFPGDKVLLYTDGIMEVTNTEDQMLGIKGLEQFLKAQSASPIEKLLEQIYEHGFAYSNYQGFGDDITLLGLEVLK